MKSTVFWDVMPCSPDGTEFILLPTSAGFLLGLLFDTEDEGDMLL
jgi:hypothetical protein